MQIPIFEKRGMDFKQFFKGTINISLNSTNFELRNPKFFFKGIKWSDDLPPENFSFFACSLKVNSSPVSYDAFVYWPHPLPNQSFIRMKRFWKSFLPTYHQLNMVMRLKLVLIQIQFIFIHYLSSRKKADKT